MRSKTALVETLQAAIEAAGNDSALADVYLFGTPRGSAQLADFSKIIRVDAVDGTLIRTSDGTRREHDVVFKIQCFVLPAEAGDLESEDEASDASFDLAEAVFDYLHEHNTLGDAVTDIDIPEGETNFEKGMANLGATRYGATNLYGTINPY